MPRKTTKNYNKMKDDIYLGKIVDGIYYKIPTQ